MKKLKNIISIFSLSSLVFIFLFSKQLYKGAVQGIELCINILIPSLFIFLIISEFFYRTKALNFILKPFSFACEKLFKIDRSICPIIFFSLICGYPAGANLIANLVQKKVISKKTASRMLYFCVNAGPSFLISGISIHFSNSITFGVMLLISQITAFLVVGIFSSIGEKLEKAQNIETIKESFKAPIALVLSVKNSIKNMAIICGFTIFFSAIINFILQLNIFNINSKFYLKPLIIGLLEVTNGAINCRQINNINIFLIIALITSFGGLCVHMQIMAITYRAKIPFKNFYLWRIIYVLVSLTTSAFIFTKFALPNNTEQKIIEQNISIHTPIISVCLLILSITLLCCDKKIIIINKKLKK